MSREKVREKKQILSGPYICPDAKAWQREGYPAVPIEAEGGEEEDRREQERKLKRTYSFL